MSEIKTKRDFDTALMKSLRTPESVINHVRSLEDEVKDLREALREKEKQIENFQTFGQGGAGFRESQLIEKLSKVEQELDALKGALREKEAILKGIEGAEFPGLTELKRDYEKYIEDLKSENRSLKSRAEREKSSASRG